MTLKLKSLLGLLIIVCAMSCQKKDNTPYDSTRVTVLFTSLTYGQLFHPGDTIPLNADVSYDAEIVGIGVQVTDSATDSVLFEDDRDIHTDHFQFTSSWIDTLTTNATLQVKILVFAANNTATPAERVIYLRSQP